jgi:hypothetical protein
MVNLLEMKIWWVHPRGARGELVALQTESFKKFNLYKSVI